MGSDRLQGDSHDDILVAGTTDHDSNESALKQIRDEWASSSSYSARVDNLSGLLNDLTVHDEGVRDQLTGADGQDWFIYNRDLTGGDHSGITDRATDIQSNEVWTDIDFLL
ncbi:MAG: hypothetical protein L0Z62_38160 [Gemmataceae bacterium]|nr:hypothetical protein [Gemmataceae bacterium]